jgi:hypothetical protein
MKLFASLVAAFALCSPAALAIHTPADAPFATRAEEASALIDACETAFNELLTTYEGIVDTATANAAVEKLPSLHVNLQTSVDKVNSIGEADAATQNLFMTKLLPMLFVNGSRTQMALERIRQNDYYGSEKLRHFMEVELQPQG